MDDGHFKLLQQSFENVNTWLRFIEGKNAALIAFNIALLAALISGSSIFQFSSILFNGVTIGLLCSIMILLLSFKPINKSVDKMYFEGIEPNLLHYAYIASLNPNEYLTKLYKFYWNDGVYDPALFPQVEKDYSIEIIQNARITVRKQQFFNGAFYLDIITILTVCVLIICT